MAKLYNAFIQPTKNLIVPAKECVSSINKKNQKYLENRRKKIHQDNQTIAKIIMMIED